jgi:hypothetical protein
MATDRTRRRFMPEFEQDAVALVSKSVTRNGGAGSHGFIGPRGTGPIIRTFRGPKTVKIGAKLAETPSVPSGVLQASARTAESCR